MKFSTIHARELLKRSGAEVSEKNARITELVVNCHVLITEDLCDRRTADMLLHAYRSLELRVLFSSLDEAASQFIDAVGQGEPLALDSSVVSYLINTIYAHYTEDRCSVRDVLQVLRFPLRLTLDSDVEEARKFLASNTSCKDWDRLLDFNLSKGWAVPFKVPTITRAGSYLVNSVRLDTSHSVIFEQILLEACDVASELRLPHNWEDLVELYSHFSSGVCSDAQYRWQKRMRLDHVGTYAAYRGYFDPYYSANPTTIDFLSKVAFVPKNWKEKRVIGELPAARSYYAQGVRGLLIHSLPKKWSKCIDLSDQCASRALTYLGSRDKSVATIDLSSASDRVPKALVRLLFPSWTPVLQTVEDRYLDVHGKQVECFMYSCAGNATTFVIETYTFFAIVEAIRRYFSRLTGTSYLLPRIYGDDIIVDDRLAEAVQDILGLFNAKVNCNKSYSGIISYRESCGAEYVDGEECSTHYFPRSYSDKLNQLISLQHALYSYPRARDYVTEEVYNRMPQMTAHIVGTPCTDLWADVDLPIVRDASDVLPHEGDLPDAKVKLHYVFVQKRITTKLFMWVSHSLYKEALIHGPLYVDDEFSSSRIGHETSYVDDRVDKDGGIVNGSYRLVVD